MSGKGYQALPMDDIMHGARFLLNVVVAAFRPAARVTRE